ncbi:peptidase [Mycoplasma sp. NEAQ87857]|uniref:SPFH domain-containing protein n=1 Tax=Mycoplasma sp. NEAQ87857 TaxID=2683967 RepID=UPI00131896CD|nr:SPFH domain-containing protein [Mycoplasma sp. NEAQ87857]QGZ97441.1 peptidase [Mycoplasma sp. NEAQ87857]
MILAIVLGVIGAIVLIIGIIALFKSIVIIPETSFAIIQRLGKFNRIIERGIHLIIPFIDKVAVKDNSKEKVFDFPAQSVITRDNATIKVDTVVYLKIVDPKLYAYGAERPIVAIEMLTATTLRNLFGELELDESLTSREIINAKLTRILDEASDNWGIKVNRVEIQNITPPKEVQEAMIRQMQAERDKRARILEAEGIKQSLVLKALGEKESTILSAEAKKRQIVLDAEAKKEKFVLEAQGQKQAIDMINSANLNPNYLQYKAIEQIKELANGKATKIIIPPNLAEVSKVIATGSEIFESTKDK